MKTPLVSILIPAFNAKEWIAETLQSAIVQTWSSKEIIVVDDGSTDGTAEVARRFARDGIKVVSTENRGAQAARNHAYELSHGDYIQWLDADDLLAPNKIEQQLAAVRTGDCDHILLSSSWAPFYYRTRSAHFVQNSLCQDLSPAEWLLRKMNENLFMQPATWLTSRRLTEAAGVFDTRLQFDDDGEYFCRVLLASEGTRFVPGTGVFYRATSSNRVSYIGNSDKKKDSLFLSMKLHIKYLRSLEESERVRKACLTYMQNWYDHFYPGRPDLMEQVQALAVELGGQLEEPCLGWKYSWIRPMFGWEGAKRVRRTLPHLKGSCIRFWDRAMLKLELAKGWVTQR